MEELLEVWQTARIDGSGTDTEYTAEDLVPQIMKLEKQQQKLLMYKTLSSVVLLLALLIVFINGMTLTVYNVMGIGIFILSVLSIIILLNRLRFRITYDERSLSTLQLAAITKNKILRERKIFTTILPLFLVVALTGFNLMCLDFFREVGIASRILYHVMITGGLAVAFVVGLAVRIKRYRKQFLPLLGRIWKFQGESG